MNWFKKMMAGRYGTDQLTFALLVLSFLFTVIAGFSIKLQVFSYLSLIPMAICIFRIFSKNINKRRMENYKSAMLFSPIYSWSIREIKKLKDLKTHKYYNCPNCKSTLRLPRGKGKISITCPKCRTEFTKKT